MHRRNIVHLSLWTFAASPNGVTLTELRHEYVVFEVICTSVTYSILKWFCSLIHLFKELMTWVGKEN